MSEEEKKKRKFFAVSNAHLDTQWNWTVVDTVRDCIKNTMDYNFALFKKYPGYKLNFEGAFRYSLMKEYYPQKYAKVKTYVHKGNWNPVGATWDAMDVNVPSGEALMRQILYGNNWFEKEFGILSKDIFLPDCFGFRASLPSVAAHMGLIGFSTQKLVWGAGSPLLSKDGAVLPPMPQSSLPRMDLGRWKGPDGKWIFVSLLEGNYTYNFDAKGDERPLEAREEIARAIEHNEKYAGVPRRSMYFGTGDYGGSCTDGSARLLQEALDRQKNGTAASHGASHDAESLGGAYPPYEVISASPTDIYEGLTEEEIQNLPIYEGGLLIPHGYGAMTSHTAMKRLNRQNELLADRTERAAIAAKFLAGEPYPKERLAEAWKTFLWHQFHDDLTGTSVANAYIYSHNDMLLAHNLFGGELQNALSAIGEILDTRGKGKAYLVFNSCAFERRETLELPFEGKNVCAYAHGGKERLPTAFAATSAASAASPAPAVSSASAASAASAASGTLGVPEKKAAFTAVLPPFSFTVFHLRDEKRRQKTSLKIGKSLLENDCLRVRLDRQYNICSIYDKRLGRELLSAPVCFEILPDSSTVWPSWEYNFEDFKKRPAFPGKGESLEVLDCRPVYVGLRITRKYKDSIFETTVKLSNGSTRLIFENRVRWYERASNLFMRFPLTAENDCALFDSDPGAVRGYNTDRYPYFMHNVHLWADQKDRSGTFGVILSNDCKYAMTKPDNRTLCLALIHTPKGGYLPASGQDWQDFGQNLFTFAIEGYGTEEERFQAIQHAEALNNPPAATAVPSAHKGTYSSISFLKLSGEGAALTAVKEEEKGELVIVRVRETEGKTQRNLRIELPHCDILELYACDGYERMGESLPHERRAFTFNLSEYEIKTFALRLPKKRSRKKEDLSVNLPMNLRLFTNRGETALEEINLPMELFHRRICAAGILYRLQKGQENACVCQGQKIALTGKRRYLRILAASKNCRKEAVFTVAGRKERLSIAPMHRPVGSVESVISGSVNHVTKDPVAAVFTHTHNGKGEDNFYDFAYFFTCELCIDGAREVILPTDGDVVLLAATETDRKYSNHEVELYDSCGEAEQPPVHRLTTEGCTGGDGDYPEGALILLHAPYVKNGAIFKGFEGAGTRNGDGCFTVVQMGKKDLFVKAVYKELGENLAFQKPCRANDEVNRRERAELALNGNGHTKWCGNRDEKGVCTLTVDLEEPKEISSYLLCHAGTVESKLWNTVDFDILTKVRSGDPWTVIDSVRDNREDVTLRSFPAQKARYVMLRILTPARDGDSHARIYSFQIFK